MFFKKRNMSSDKNYNDKNYEPENLGEGAETIDVDPSEEVQPEGAEVAADEEISEIETLKNLLQAKETEVEKEKKEYLFLMAEFDNFRKRTIRERSELVKNASA